MPESIMLGSQDCSAYLSGPYTGQVCAVSLKELRCSAVIVGHYESRQRESKDERRDKINVIRKQGMIPIICVGESLRDRDDGLATEVIAHELSAMLGSCKQGRIVKEECVNLSRLIIAYEPHWAIGTDQVPSKDYIARVIKHIRELAGKAGRGHVDVLYGGSITAKSLKSFEKLDLDGFLVGRASTDFQELKKIVS